MNSNNLTKTIAENLFSIFQGSDIAHGTFVTKGTSINGKKQGIAKVIREPTTIEMWEKHLNGEVGIGIIPIKSDNNCFWGAIDIDEYDIIQFGVRLGGSLDLPPFPIVIFSKS